MRTTTVTTAFAADHRDEHCGPHPHGHTFNVQVTERGPTIGLLSDLQEVAAELHLHSLDDMLVGGVQTLESMSNWFMERLLLRHPRTVNVVMWFSDKPEERIGVDREIR